MNDVLETPLYYLSDAARLSGTTASALKRWSDPYEVKRRYTKARVEQPLIIAEEHEGSRLFSFLNLIEAHFVTVYRRSGVALRAIQAAVEYSRGEFDDEHPLRRRRFKSDGCNLFHDVEQRDGFRGLVAFSSSGQLAWPDVVRAFFESVEYDEENRPFRWWPQGTSGSIVVDPRFAFGYPVVTGKFVRTDVLAERFQGGEAVEEIALDFSIDKLIVEDAVRYEMGLQAA